MYNIEDVHCTTVIFAVLNANLHLMNETVEQALKSVLYGKDDTLALDGLPESIIVDTIKRFDKDAILITEEVGATKETLFANQNVNPVLYLSDPTDRSSCLKGFLEKKDPTLTIGEIVQKSEAITEWETDYSFPAQITGSFSAITCIRYGVPICTALVNFITQELYIAYHDGTYVLKLPPYTELRPEIITLEYIKNNGKAFSFRSFNETGEGLQNMKYFVTYLGKSVYKENFRDSDLISENGLDKFLRYNNPGGPSRILYLSEIEPASAPLGFILANGEKIGEWIHWLPFIRYGMNDDSKDGPGLFLYEINQERPWTKNGILMCTSPHYSIFSSNELDKDTMVLDVSKFRNFDNPSQIRSTILIAPSTNTWIKAIMEQHLYREIAF